MFFFIVGFACRRFYKWVLNVFFHFEALKPTCLAKGPRFGEDVLSVELFIEYLVDK